jgi:hypothetical protein
MQWLNEDDEADDPVELYDVEDDGEWDESLLPTAGAALLGIPPPLAMAAGRMFRRPTRAPLRRVSVGGGGVRTARVDTPRGSAQLALPSAVPTLDQLKALEQAVNRNTERLNSAQREVEGVGRRLDGVTADVLAKVARVRRDLKREAFVQMCATSLTHVASTAFYSQHTHRESGGGETQKQVQNKSWDKQALPFVAAFIPLATWGVQSLLAGRARR